MKRDLNVSGPTAPWLRVSSLGLWIVGWRVWCVGRWVQDLRIWGLGLRA